MKCEEVRKQLMSGNAKRRHIRHLSVCSECAGFASLVRDLEQEGRRAAAMDMSDEARLKVIKKASDIVGRKRAERIAFPARVAIVLSRKTAYAAAALLLLAGGLFFIVPRVTDRRGGSLEGPVAGGSGGVEPTLRVGAIDRMRSSLDSDLRGFRYRFTKEQAYLDRQRRRLESRLAVTRARVSMLNGGAL